MFSALVREVSFVRWAAVSRRDTGLIKEGEEDTEVSVPKGTSIFNPPPYTSKTQRTSEERKKTLEDGEEHGLLGRGGFTPP